MGVITLRSRVILNIRWSYSVSKNHRTKTKLLFYFWLKILFFIPLWLMTKTFYLDIV